MWEWLSGLAKRFSVTALLREQLAIYQARASNLETQNGEIRTKAEVLEGELKELRSAYGQTEEELQRLKAEYAEEVLINDAIEFRRGKRTGRKWVIFCPSCHIPAFTDYKQGGECVVRCSTSCGWAGIFFRKGELEQCEAGLPN